MYTPLVEGRAHEGVIADHNVQSLLTDCCETYFRVGYVARDGNWRGILRGAMEGQHRASLVAACWEACHVGESHEG